MPTYRITGGVLSLAEQGSNYPDNTLPGIPGPVDPGYGISSDRPMHPIVIPPDAIAPGVPTQPIYLPVYPSHPIVIPPGAISPGPPLLPTHPIYLPVYPSHPIVIPPNAVGPGLPEFPVVLPPVDPGYSPPWATPGTGPVDPGYGIDAGLRPTHPIAMPPLYPSHPIVIPPEAIVPQPDGYAHVVVYYQGQRVTFSVEMPKPTVPTEPAPKR